MGKTLVIVESPAKAKTINEYLDSDYVVKSSTGHIRDSPTSGSVTRKNADSILTKTAKEPKKGERGALVNRIGVGPWHDWGARYEVLPGRGKVVSELKQLAEKADHIYLTIDPDREREVIAWHLREVINGDDTRYSHVVFSGITKNAIRQVLEKSSELNIDRVSMQQARRFMDRIVGCMVSPLLWRKIARGLSVGCVQSVAVRLVVERERETEAFVPEEFREIDASTTAPGGDALLLEVTHQNNKPFRLANREQTLAAVSLLEKVRCNVLERGDKPTNSKPSTSSTISTLQQAASTCLGSSMRKTMMMAQRLYEVGYTTCIRTDSTNLSQDVVTMVRDYISDNFGKEHLSEGANQYVSKENSQEAHRAIRPSDVAVPAESLKGMEIGTQRLRQLIWRQLVAYQVMPTKYDSTILTVGAGDFRLKTRGRILRFDGWIKVVPTLREDDEDHILPAVDRGDTLALIELTPTQHFAKPPICFSRASPVRELEKRDIGRPPAYASIISTIQDCGYVRVENRRFYTEKMSEVVTDRLEENLRKLMNYDFTAQMEDSLDQVANHEAEWKGILNNFFTSFTQQLDKAEKDPGESSTRPNQMVLTSTDCPICGRKMGVRTANTDVFPGCFSYALSPEERRRATTSSVPEDEVLNVLGGDGAGTNALCARRRCQRCGMAMDSYLVDSKRKLHVCGNNSTYDGYEIEEGEFRIRGYDGLIIGCEKCGSEMHLKIGRFGRYMAYTNDECKNTRKVLHNDEVAPPKEDPASLPELPCEKPDAYFVLRDDTAGILLAANVFPRSRETCTLLMEELCCFHDRLPEKLHYLADAPQIDPDGNKSMARFNRKTKQQYAAVERDDKAIGWSVFFADGKWVEGKK